MKAIVLCGLLYALVGCSVNQPIETVQVPVYVKPAAPQELLDCGYPAPGFQFYGRSEDSNDVVILEKDQPAFQDWIHKKNRCLDARKEFIQP